MDVRGRRLRKQSDEAAAFTSSMAFDWAIARHVIRTNMAHMVSLVREGEVSRSTGAKCLKFLARASPGEIEGSTAEDFHQLLEQRAVDALGVEVAGHMNLGKSRNDQVATAIRMETRERLIGLLEALVQLQESSLGVAERYGTALIPGYTHLQRAQPLTLAHHFFAYFDSLQRDVDRILQLYDRVNVSPMGSAALGGTDVKLDRGLVAELLGFDGISSNSMDGVTSRDFVVEALSCACMIMIDISRLAEEQVLWSSKEFGFLEVDDRYAASSSIMPQKKNPVVAEMARSKCGSVMGSLVAVTSILKSLPYSYNLDLQETTPHLWRAMDDATASVNVLARSLSSSKFNLDAIRESMKDDFSTATALANYLVRNYGVSFRQAHGIVGELVRLSIEDGVGLAETASERLPLVSSKLAKRMTIQFETAEAVLDPSNFLSSIVTEGGSNPAFIPSGLKLRSGELSRTRALVSHLKSSLAASDRKLTRESARISTEVKK